MRWFWWDKGIKIPYSDFLSFFMFDMFVLVSKCAVQHFCILKGAINIKKDELIGLNCSHHHPLQATDLLGLRASTPSSWQRSCRRCPSSRPPLPPPLPACPPPPQPRPAPVSPGRRPSARNATAARRVQAAKKYTDVWIFVHFFFFFLEFNRQFNHESCINHARYILCGINTHS